MLLSPGDDDDRGRAGVTAETINEDKLRDLYS